MVDSLESDLLELKLVSEDQCIWHQFGLQMSFSGNDAVLLVDISILCTCCDPRARKVFHKRGCKKIVGTLAVVVEGKKEQTFIS